MGLRMSQSAVGPGNGMKCVGNVCTGRSASDRAVVREHGCGKVDLIPVTRPLHVCTSVGDGDDAEVREMIAIARLPSLGLGSAFPEFASRIMDTTPSWAIVLLISLGLCTVSGLMETRNDGRNRKLCSDVGRVGPLRSRGLCCFRCVVMAR